MADNETNNNINMEMKIGDEIKPSREMRSNFSVTCSLLSQYLKEKGRFGELEMAKGKSRSAPTTMSLLPGLDVSKDNTDHENVTRTTPKSMDFFPMYVGPQSTVTSAQQGTDKVSIDKELRKAQMTIFYGGKIMVFDNFPAEKAKDLMQIASNESFTTPQNFRFKAPPQVSKTEENNNSFMKPANASDMPIARRNSLQRFLEKRKDRISTIAPYQVHGGSSSSSSSADAAKLDDSQGWLGLGPKISEPQHISGTS